MKLWSYLGLAGVLTLSIACDSVESSSRNPTGNKQGADEKTSDVVLVNTATPGTTTPTEPGVNQDVDDGANNSAECYKGDPFICEIEAAIVRQTNELRAPSRPFTLSPKIGYISRLWSESQGKMGFISHMGFPGSRTSDYEEEFGGSPYIMAENVAMSYADGNNAEDIAEIFTDMWWNSWGHRANMQGDYDALGVGVYRSGSSYYATQIFGSEP